MFSALEKKLYVLDRLANNDRIIRQRPDGAICPDAAWFLQRPQGSIWISTVSWLERHGMIAENIGRVADTGKRAPYSTDDEMRTYYQSGLRHRVYGITGKGQTFLDANF